MSEKLECSSHWLNFWETAWYLNNLLVRPRHIGLTNCQRKVHILWEPGWATCQDLLRVDSAVILLPELVLQNWKNAQKRLIYTKFTIDVGDAAIGISLVTLGPVPAAGVGT